MRTLAVRPGGIGDIVVSLPAIEGLRAGYLEVWAPSAVLPLIRFADSVRPIAGSGLDLLGIPDREPPAALLDRLRRFDRIVSWHGTNLPEFGQAVRDLGLPFEFLSALPGRECGVHAVDFYSVQVGLPPGAMPRLDCSREDGGFAVIHPFSGSPRKNWPLANFREVARRIETDMPVFWCAGPEEELEGAVRYEDLWDLACWLARASLYIGNDSGITHLAAAAGAPVIAIFGPTNPKIWAPRGDVRLFEPWPTVDAVLSLFQNPRSARLPDR